MFQNYSFASHSENIAVTLQIMTIVKRITYYQLQC